MIEELYEELARKDRELTHMRACIKLALLNINNKAVIKGHLNRALSYVEPVDVPSEGVPF